MPDPALDPWRDRVRVDPPLTPSEIAFVVGFTPGSTLRRVWPGQPSVHSPWRPTDDGTALELDREVAMATPAVTVGWLRFLSREFLAPCNTAALDRALEQGLRAGHRVNGEVQLAGIRVVVVDSRVDAEVCGPAPDAGSPRA